MMRGSAIFSGFLLFCLLCVGSPVLAHQSGGVEIGSLETGSVVLKPGGTKYIGIPTSDLTYVTANNSLIYGIPADMGCLSGQLLIIQ